MSDLKSFFHSEKIKEFIPDFERRKEQEDLSKNAAKAFRENRFLIAEAGTGTGKSLAYLFPAAEIALENDCTVVISTETIALQNQLLLKDIPIVKSVIGKNLRAMQALGASNYVCKRKMNNVISRGDFPPEMNPHLKDFYAWERETSAGIKSEYKGFALPEFWNKITRDPENCMGRHCPNFSASYYFLEKEKWKTSHILIVNHHLLAAHITGEGKLLPEFRYLVIDEAHSFGDILGRSMMQKTGYEDIQNILSRVSGTEKKPGLKEKYPALFSEKISELVKKSRKESEDYFAFLQSCVPLLFSAKRMTSKTEADSVDLEKSLLQIASVLDKTSAKLKEDSESQEDKELLLELNSLITALDGNAKILHSFTEFKSKNTVFWLDVPREGSRNSFYEIYMQPLEYENHLKEKLFSELNSVIFTSATISSGNSDFSYFERQLGIEEPMKVSYPSPFPYKKNCIIYLPKTLRDPGEDNEGYHDDLAKLIPYLLDLTSGGAFVLFTANSSLKKVLEKIEPDLPYPVFSQLKLGAEKAKNAFLETENSVLFGVSSFWQGVDVKGDRLRSVILCRIPFQPPGDPVTEAMIEGIKKKNGNPFFDFQLPYAVLSMKQGFGRLIRSKTDKGIVSILDPRILTKGYGRNIIGALPESRMAYSFKDLKAMYSEFRFEK